MGRQKISKFVLEKERLRRLISRYIGYEISNKEFEYRFEDIDLEYYHRHMESEIFKAFVKGLGAIPGSSKLFHKRKEEID